MNPKNEQPPVTDKVTNPARYSANRRKARAGRRESEAFLMFALQASNTGVWDIDLIDRKVRRSPEHDRIFGYDVPQPEWTYRMFLDHILPEDRTRVNQLYRQARENLGDWNIECRIRRADGKIRWIRTAGRHRRDDSGNPRNITGIVQDITDRKEAEAELEKLLVNQQRHQDELERRVVKRTTELKRRADQLARLASELTMAEQRERRRLAEALHDHLQQILVAVRMQTDQLQLEESNSERQSTFALVHDMLTEAITSTRSLSRDLSPPVLHHGGLSAALHWLAEDMQQKHKLAIDVHTHGESDEIPYSLSVFLYTAARELLFNITKHAETPAASVRLVREGNAIRLEVTDMGKGFDTAHTIQANGDSGGFGLFSIQERAEFLGGRLNIDSRIGRGSRFVVHVPVPESPEAIPAPGGKDARTAPPLAAANPDTATPCRTLRILLVDDHRMMREGLMSLLQGQEGVEVVGQADNGKQAVERVENLLPDVVTMDVSMPVMDGIEATRIIKKRWPAIRVIGLSMFEEAELAAKMHAAGADRYLTKTGPSQLLIEAIRAQ